MSRPTLKLPVKPAQPDHGEARGEARRTTVRKAPNRHPSVPKPAPVAVPRVAPAITPAPTAPAAKVYPKRGIARSTGARALPPVRPGEEPTLASSAANPAIGERQRVKAPNDDERPRLAHLITRQCGCSRREADDWIENGWVRVDGAVVSTLGIRVDRGARIAISDEAGKHQNEQVTMLYHKPARENDDVSPLRAFTAGNRWADDAVPKSFKPTQRRGLLRASQLAAELSGMLVFTQEESVKRRLARDESLLEKEYTVQVEGDIAPDGIELLRRGLTLDGVKLKAAQVSWQSERQLRFVLRENWPQQLERMCQLVGLRATSIRLIRIGSVSLGKLPPGQWRYSRENERF